MIVLESKSIPRLQKVSNSFRLSVFVLHDLMLGFRLFMELTLSCVLDARWAHDDDSLLSRRELAFRSLDVALNRRVRRVARARAVCAARARVDAEHVKRVRAAAASALALAGVCDSRW